MPKTAATSAEYRCRCARERTARWRARTRRGALVLPLELDSEMLDLLQRLEHLRDSQITGRQAIAGAARRVLTRAMGLLVRHELQNFR